MTGRDAVLVVDDCETQRKLLTEVLVRRGYEVLHAADGPTALTLAGDPRVGLALLDIGMPRMDGFEVLRRLRTIRPAAELPCIIVTGRSADEVIVQALAAGANDYVSKPIDLPVLLARIEVHLARVRAERALRQSEARFALAVQGTHDGIWDWDFATGEFFLSARWKELLGYGVDELPCGPQEWLDRVHPEDRERLEAAIAELRDGGTTYLGVEHRLLHRDGSYRWMLARGIAQVENGRTVRVTGSQTDLTDRKHIDPVTGLPNRAVFQEKLAEAASPGGAFALLLCNLDRFKLVNDSFGIERGDRALVNAAAALRTCLHGVGFLAHLGADEFAVLVGGVCPPAEALQLGDAILEMLRAPLDIGGDTVEVSASIGIAMFDGRSGADSTLRDAQVALRRAKETGGGKAELFEPKMQSDARRRLDLERDLRQALRQGELFPMFQPIVSLADQRILGFEALARWKRSGNGFISPAEFIPIAEQTGLVKALDQHILDAALRTTRGWRNPHGKPPFISVNFSAHQLGDPCFVDAVLERMEAHGIGPGQLKLEITESALMADPDAAEAAMTRLVERGVGLAIDDFGTGYCSLAYLHRFPADTLKIDRYFVAKMEEQSSVVGIVQAIIDLAHGLGMAVVAEGIETRGQCEKLRQLGCDFGQGYLFAKPVEAEAALRMMTEMAAA